MKNFTEKELEVAINKMFEIAGHDVSFNKIKEMSDKAKDLEELLYQTMDEEVIAELREEIRANTYHQVYTMTQEQEHDFRDWLRIYLKPYTHKNRLEKEIGRFILNYSLKIPCKN